MVEVKTHIVADNIVSPLGFSSAENYSAVKRGESALRRYEGKWNLPEAFVASLTDRDKVLAECADMGITGNYTYFERMAILSICKALNDCDIDASATDVLFILSTTKGNIDLLRANESHVPQERELLGVSAKAIAEYFKNPNEPVVVSNACISGVCAQICAMRLLEAKAYRHIIVCGVDVQSPFIISGFQSFKALSEKACRPFDKERDGLNLGDAAATIIYSIDQPKTAYGKEKEARCAWQAVSGAIRNDANHISGPSRTGEGSYRCLRSVMQNFDAKQLAFINTHGTATLYNDEMEAIAIDRSGLISVPVNSLKGYYGHTMGAAGVLETIISMRAIDDNTVLGTRGFHALGVSKEVKVSPLHRPTEKLSFIKLLSGFGGCNAAMLFSKTKMEDEQ